MKGHDLAEQLDKLLEKRYAYYVNNENHKINYIILILTFFIAIGEISNIIRNYIEVQNQKLFLIIFGVCVFVILILFFIIVKMYNNRFNEASETIGKQGNEIIDSLRRS